MKDYDQILRHTVENVFPAFPISDQGHCDKRKDATPGGFFPIPSFVPSPPPYFVMLWRWCFYHRVLFLTPVSLLLLSLPLLLCAPTDISTLPVKERKRDAGSQRQAAHPSITPAGSLWCWALSSTSQLLPSIKMCRWAGTPMCMHTSDKNTNMDLCVYPW